MCSAPHFRTSYYRIFYLSSPRRSHDDPSRYSLSHRLGRRKALFEKRKRISDYALVMGMFGIIVMVLENELSSAGVYTKVSACAAWVQCQRVVLRELIRGNEQRFHILWENGGRAAD